MTARTRIDGYSLSLLVHPVDRLQVTYDVGDDAYVDLGGVSAQYSRATDQRLASGW